MVSSTLRVKSSSVIKPAEPTPKHRLWVSDLDLIQPVTHAPTVYFFRPNNTDNFFSIETMKTALSQALVHFYPLAGRLCYDQTGRLEIDCNEAGVVFYEAECEDKIDDFGNFKPTPELRENVPHHDYSTHISEWPLVLVQLTVFRCGGMCLGLAISHTVIDGMSAIHFVSTWAKIARTGMSGIDVKPFIDRTLLRASDPPVQPAFDHEEFNPPPEVISHEDDGIEGVRKKESTVEMLKFTSKQVNAIKQACNAGQNGISNPKFSRYESVSAHLWRCTCKARGLPDKQLTKVYAVADGRTRLRPSLPARFFGNVVFSTTPIARSGELVSKPMGYAAGLIREAFAKMNDEYLRSALDFLHGQKDLTELRFGSHTLGCNQGRFYGYPNLTLTSWLGMTFYDADFGWGPPIHMGPAALGSEGKGFVLPTSEEDGSLVVAYRLQTKHMEAFKKLIYEGL